MMRLVLTTFLAIMLTTSQLFSQDSFRNKTNFFFLNVSKTKEDVRHSKSVLDYMLTEPSSRNVYNTDRIVTDLRRATKVLKHLEKVVNSIGVDLVLSPSCYRLAEKKGFAIERELQGALLAVERAAGFTDNRLRYSLGDLAKFSEHRLMVLKELEKYDTFISNLRQDWDVRDEISRGCDIRENPLKCREITGLLDEAGEVISYADGPTINSDWFKAMAVFEYYDEYYALVVLNERAYIFCDLSESLANDIIPSLSSERAFEDFYHQRLKEHTCDCN